MDNITAESDVTDEYGNPKAVQLQVLDSKTYDKVVKKKQNWNNFWVTVGEQMLVADAVYSSADYSGRTESYNGAVAYLAQEKADDNVKAYANKQAQRREKINAGYIKNNTVKDGIEYSGFFNIKYKKVDQLSIRFMINGEPFSFTY